MKGVRTEIMRNRFGALVEEASIILYRTAHTTFIKQTQDYQCAMCTTEGEVFAYPRFNGVATLVGLSLKPRSGARPIRQDGHAGYGGKAPGLGKLKDCVIDTRGQTKIIGAEHQRTACMHHRPSTHYPRKMPSEDRRRHSFTLAFSGYSVHILYARNWVVQCTENLQTITYRLARVGGTSVPAKCCLS